ncbi:MAG TPA: polysaccharide pyruvyl transferase CsaB [Candidatus Eremiobacteraceae bacterium]|nr:polysaccharide pyruvyl transferase CsaB [Candidatus Eremiobacteraceae bacterium]
MSDRPARLLLSGYYGFANFGDEAILDVMVEQWRRRRPMDELVVLSESPEQTARTYGVQAVPRMAWRAVSDAVRAADVTVSGGGGLLQSATSLRSLLYYASVIREAKRAGRKAAIFAQGIGPLNYFGREVVKRSCARVDLACVRDELSQGTLKALLPGVEVRLSADPVFLADAAESPQARAALVREGLRDDLRDVVAVVVRRGPALDQVTERLVSVCDRLASRHGAHVVFVPLQPPHDAEAAITVIRRCKSAPALLTGGYDLATMTALLSRCSAVISMRLHALILAARLAVPFLAVPYDPKIEALTAGLAYPMPPLTRESLAEELTDQWWSRRPALREHLRARVPGMQVRAMAAFDWLQALVEREGAPLSER